MPTKKLNASQPIGIFDSGIGGLTVANAIAKVLPNEQLIYFGDTAHLPYGDKSPDSIKYYSIRIAQFLLEQNCKIIVIACNTASALAYETVKDFVGNKVPVIDVVNPIVDEIALNKKIKHIGVIATKGTVKSDVYAKKLKHTNKNLEVSSLAAPLLVSMIEEGFFNNKTSRTIIHDYLSRPKLKKIDSLILACTHYPLIKPEVEEYYKGKVKIFDPAEAAAKKVYETLKGLKLLSPKKNNKHRFYMSDYTKSFEESSRFFFKSKIKLTAANIWK
ncbi:MAG TPA: glutamate racemase [Bacteroidia bacterium]|jgi:glutamate racemase|nr:glutamate racemase [Bacteroidia bacterium]